MFSLAAASTSSVSTSAKASRRRFRSTSSASDSIFSPTSLDALASYVAELQRDPRVARVESLVSLDPRITREQYHLIYAPAAATGDPARIAEPFARNVARQVSSPHFTLVRVTSRYAQTAPESKELVERIRTVPIGGGLRPSWWAVEPPGSSTTPSGLYRDFPRVLIFIVLSTYLILSPSYVQRCCRSRRS